jgi:chromosome segregation ATPase
MNELKPEDVMKALECFHQRILNTDLAKNIYEAEITAIIDALALIESHEQRIESYRQELAEVRVALAEANKEKQELTEECKSYKSIAEYQQSCNMDRGFKIKRLTEENERLRGIPEQLHKEMSERMTEERKIERKLAVRKFAERLKAETITIQDHTGKLGSVVLVGTIDQIAKEMLEGNE